MMHDVCCSKDVLMCDKGIDNQNITGVAGSIHIESWLVDIDFGSWSNSLRWIACFGAKPKSILASLGLWCQEHTLFIVIPNRILHAGPHPSQTSIDHEDLDLIAVVTV